MKVTRLLDENDIINIIGSYFDIEESKRKENVTINIIPTHNGQEQGLKVEAVAKSEEFISGEM